MAFVNTRDTIGDQATVDGLVEHSLTELKEDGISILPAYAVAHNDGLTKLSFPNVIKIRTNAFTGCNNLEVVELGDISSNKQIILENQAFTGCSKLKHFVIYNNKVASLSSAIFYNNPIEKKDGAVYVPADLLSSYKNNLSGIFVQPLEKYPMEFFDTIEDSWNTIFNNANYSSNYAIGDTKSFKLSNNTIIKMRILDFDKDEKSDGSGNAKITWRCEFVYIYHRTNSSQTTENGWGGSEIRSYLNNDLLSLIPSEIRSHIVSVKKSYKTASPTNETLWSDDKLWLLSLREVNKNNSRLQEDEGVIYSDAFPYGTATVYSANDFTKTATYALRTAGNSSNFITINSTGDASVYVATNNDTTPSVFGFCTD